LKVREDLEIYQSQLSLQNVRVLLGYAQVLAFLVTLDSSETLLLLRIDQIVIVRPFGIVVGDKRHGNALPHTLFGAQMMVLNLQLVPLVVVVPVPVIAPPVLLGVTAEKTSPPV